MKTSSKDITAALSVTLLSALWICFLPRYNIVPYVLAMFLIPGYMLVTAVCPLKDDLSPVKRIVSSLAVAALIGGIFFVASGQEVLGAYPENAFLIMVVLTVILVLFTALERYKHSRIKDIDEGHVLKVANLRNATYPEKAAHPSGKKAAYPRKDAHPQNSSDDQERNPIKAGKKVFTDLAIMTLITVLCAVFVLTPKLNHTFIRTILGLLLILFVPGYSLIAALFPKKSDLDGIERAALSFGLSVLLTALIGFALKYTPWGIKGIMLTPILISLSAFTLIMVFLAFLRRMRLPSTERFSVPFGSFTREIRKDFKGESRTSKILSIVLIITIVLAIATTAYIVIKPKQGEKFTEFYILGPNGKAADYPTNITAGQSGSVIIGVVNHEYKPVNYEVVVKLNGTVLKTQNITLNNTQKLEVPYNFTTSGSGKKEMEFLLYKLPDQSNAYRSLHLWININ